MIRDRLERLGIDLLEARNTTLQSLVREAPPPVVAELLGYRYTTTQLHAEIAAQPWARQSPNPRRRPREHSEVVQPPAVLRPGF